jgi:hypothetical protein
MNNYSPFPTLYNSNELRIIAVNVETYFVTVSFVYKDASKKMIEKVITKNYIQRRYPQLLDSKKYHVFHLHN